MSTKENGREGRVPRGRRRPQGSSGEVRSPRSFASWRPRSYLWTPPSRSPYPRPVLACLASVYTASFRPGRCLPLPCHLTIDGVQNCSPWVLGGPWSCGLQGRLRLQEAAGLPRLGPGRGAERGGGGGCPGHGVEGKERRQCPLVVQDANDSRPRHPRFGQAPSDAGGRVPDSAGEAGVTFQLKYQ